MLLASCLKKKLKSKDFQFKRLVLSLDVDELSFTKISMVEEHMNVKSLAAFPLYTPQFYVLKETGLAKFGCDLSKLSHLH